MNDIYSIAGVTRQGHQQSIKRQEELDNKAVVYIGMMEKVREDHPGMGLRLMYEQFSPEGIGRDAFINLGLLSGYRLQSYRNPVITTKSIKSNRYKNLLEGFKVTGINQLWVSDITYYTATERHYYIVLIMDVYSRRIIGYSVSDNMKAENNLSALNMALALRGIEDYLEQLIHHSDRGLQYVANQYTERLESKNIRISMCTNVLENAHSERLNGTIKNDYLRRWQINLGKDLMISLPKAVANYNNRNHRSLPNMSPEQFEYHLLTNKSDIEIPIYTTPKINLNNNQLKLKFSS